MPIWRNRQLLANPTILSLRGGGRGVDCVITTARQHDPEVPVHLRQPRPWLTRFPHGELLPKRQVLERQLAVRAKTASQCPDEDSEP